jgi:hypothetical protein
VLCESCSGAGRQEFSQVDALSITICRSFSDRSLTPKAFPPLALVVRQEDFWAENVGNASKVALYRITYSHFFLLIDSVTVRRRPRFSLAVLIGPLVEGLTKQVFPPPVGTNNGLHLKRPNHQQPFRPPSAVPARTAPFLRTASLAAGRGVDSHRRPEPLKRFGIVPCHRTTAPLHLNSRRV